MMKFTREEQILIALYSPGTKSGLIRALTEMKGQLMPDEAELKSLTDNVLRKLGGITEDTFARLDFYNF